MPKKRTKPEDGSGEQSPRKGKAVNFWVSHTLHEAFERFYRSFSYKPKKAEIFRRALKELLRQEKAWTEDDEKREAAEGFED